MIAYHILCHDNLSQVVRLLDAVYDRDDVYLIDIDDSNNPDLRVLNALPNRPNVHIMCDANIGWGGCGTLRKTINGAFKLLDLRKNWQYYVVLSGQDLPLKSNQHIKDALAARENEKINYIECHASRPLSPDQVPQMQLVSRSTASTNGDYQLLADRGHTRVYIKPGTMDIHYTMHVRTLLNVIEVGGKSEVYLENAEPLLLQSRANYFRKYPFHTGANWFNLHREFLEYMRNDAFALELFSAMRTTFIPDESYFQTYIMSTRFRDSVCGDIGRHILRPLDSARNADVKVFDQHDWDSISQSSALYGRKFDTRRDLQIVDQVLEARAG